MGSFFASIATLLTNNNKSWIAQILTGAGIGLVSVIGMDTFVDYYKQQALSSLGSVGTITGLLGIAGVDRCISIIIGAYLASVYIKTFATGLKAVKK